MKTLEWTFEDKTDWGSGLWQNEPDKKQWLDESTGLPCLIHRGPSGALCGYVGVAVGHPDFEREYNDVDVDVHGGLTFDGFCVETKRENGSGICHIVEDGENDRVWWLGFDCAHYMDVTPASDARNRKLGYDWGSEGVYRDLAYVTHEVKQLARQLKDRLRLTTSLSIN